ncbi:NAD P-binding protein [Gloeophyllum trabeum ATCC 11539]|uniref:NAD P-binding protein n=1 Tax=Gloeophyllum trabeum (strain ATCC 11539 / FP-39264 / Madison 617) TaxID=670483 RepID=S7RXB0_GLOTA|nr:NAD P-binding protein [Gloeophyllum trabeum ATCC 11539]EPQ59525.1 NAD P-binding protein [Gloeophyllum trabeum ATCC 11539]
MSAKTHIFITGATGYIGGTILQCLLQHPRTDSFDITALVRDPKKIELLKSFGVSPVIGSHSDLETLENTAAQADVVITAADCDDLPAAEAILRGQKKTYDKTGKAPILIHTVSVLRDNAGGMFATDNVYSDLDINLIETLPHSQPHRPVDVIVSEAGRNGYVRTHIVLPSTIYGIARGPLFYSGMSNPQSIQIPALIRAGWARGQGGVIGQGKNIWPCIHIDELGDLYTVLFDSALSNPETPNGREGYYFGESDHYLLYDVAKAVSAALAKLGRGTSEPTTFTDEEFQKFRLRNLGGNSRCRADRSRAIGWKPTKTTQDLLDSIKPEIQALIANRRIEN